MMTYLRMLTMAIVAVVAVGFSTRPAEAQVSVGISTPGFALGVGPGAGFVAGGYYPGYPAVVAPPVFYPRPVVVAPPIVARPYYGGGFVYGRPGYVGPRYGYPVRRYR